MKIFVTGGSGFVGSWMLEQLAQTGASIRLLARKPSSKRVQQLVARYQCEIHPGNILDPGSLAVGLAGTDGVIHLVGIISEVGENTYENIHWRGTQNVIGAAQKNSVRRFIHMSALGTRPRAAARYHQSKWAGEEAVRKSGLEYTIFRPSIIYGAGDHFVNLLAGLSRLSPILPIIGSGDSKLQPVSVEEVAHCFVRALTLPISIGLTYDLCGPERLSFAQLFDQILQVSGRHRLKVSIPLPLARGMAMALEWFFPRILRKAPPLNRDQLIMLQEDNVGDPEPARAMFGFNSLPFREGIAHFLN